MTSSQSLPTSMPAWTFSSVAGGLEANLRLNQVAPVPPVSSSTTPPSTLVRVLSMSINPVDWKLAEIPLVGRFIHGGYPCTPGFDFVGRVWKTTDPALKSGDVVYGSLNQPSKYGTLAGYTVINNPEWLAKMPSGYDFENRVEELGAVGVAGATPLQCFQEAGFTTENSGNGRAVFINGSSGGTGIFTVQLAKHCLGFSHVVASCSGANADFVRSLGADEVIDYRSTSVPEALQAWSKAHNGQQFDLIIDNVGADAGIYWSSATYLKQKGKYFQVGATVSPGSFFNIFKIFCWPAVLGGGQRVFRLLTLEQTRQRLELLGKWMAEGKLKTVVDSRFTMEEAPKAFERMKTGRARGKVVVRVAER